MYRWSRCALTVDGSGRGLAVGEFGVLGAYDGHRQTVSRQKLGRIAVDATWHHWFHNILGFNKTSARYYKIRNYWWNVAHWLARPAMQRSMYNNAVYDTGASNSG
jgi:hypothetical protein